MCKNNSLYQVHTETPVLPFANDEPAHRVVQNLTERTLRIDADKDLYLSQQVVRFSLPNDGLLNPSSVEMAFTLGFEVVTNPSNASRPFSIPADVRTVFKRARILIGRTCVIADVTEYGMLCKLMTVLTSTVDDAVGIDGPLRGCMLEGGITNMVPGQRARLNYHNVAGGSATPIGSVPRRYIVKLDLGFLQQNSYVPLHLLQAPMIVELTIEDFSACAFLSGNTTTNPIVRGTVKIANPELLFTIKNTTYDENATIVKTLQSKPLVYNYTGIDHSRTQLVLSQTQHRIVIPTFRKRIKYALAIMRNELDAQNAYVDSTTTYLSLDPRMGNTGTGSAIWSESDNPRLTALKTYQWQLGSSFRFPDQPARVCDMPLPNYTSGGEAIDVGYTGQAPEAFYHLVHTVGLERGIGINAETMWGYYETGRGPSQVNNGVTFSNKLNVTSTYDAAQTQINNIRAYTSLFVMAGRFCNIGVDGKMEYLDGASNNDKLTLNLNFNAPYNGNAFAAGDPKLHVDVYVFYDANLRIDKDMTVTLDV